MSGLEKDRCPAAVMPTRRMKVRLGFSIIKYKYKIRTTANPNSPTTSTEPHSLSSTHSAMHPPTRTTRSKANPGLVDRPGSRRPSTVVAQEKAKKQQVAASKAEELRLRTARVKEVEREVRKAQAEAQSARQGGGGKVIKKAFPRPSGDTNVSFSSRSMCPGIHKTSHHCDSDRPP